MFKKKLLNTSHIALSHPIAFFHLLVLLLFLGTPANNGFCRDVQLSWNSNPDPDLAGYKIYYGVISRQYAMSIDVGNRITFTLSGLEDEKTYYISATAYNTDGLESDYSMELVASPGQSVGTSTGSTGKTTITSVTPSEAGQGGGGGGCFIATAAYGSYLAPEVMVLRHFRDHYLLPYAAGKQMVAFYYRHSPPIADFIARHKMVRVLTRLALSPLVYFIKYATFDLTLILFTFMLAWHYRTRSRHNAYRLREC